MIPNGPGVPASAQWREIRPELSAEPYVFAAGEPPPGVSAFAVIREDEGVTAIVTRAAADRAGMAYDYPRRGSRCGSAPR